MYKAIVGYYNLEVNKKNSTKTNELALAQTVKVKKSIFKNLIYKEGENKWVNGVKNKWGIWH